MNKQLLQQTIDHLAATQEKINEIETFVGLDGYIDLIQRAVKSEKNGVKEFFPTIAEIAAHIAKASGVSAQIELVTQEIKLGGNAPIMAHALGSLGFTTSCIGNFGKTEIHPVFKNISERVTLLSVGESAMTNALEFHDGKLILSEVGPFTHQDWTFIRSTVEFSAITQRIENSSLVALVDWCNLPYATDTWQGILADVLPKINKKPRVFFFDIADPSRRPDEDLKKALDVVAGYNDYGKVILGLNENETEKVYTALNRLNNTNPDTSLSLIEKGKYIFNHINVWNLLIHPTNRSISITKEKVVELMGRFVKEPKISTGGGDNFNAGFCLGQMLGFSMEESMIAAMANSGAYVQNGNSPSVANLINYISQWQSEL
ncbi:MAG: hypothetical protein U5K79_01355 [Cyclobacteriaceae bacterium]|nr:hypothetical protein [Cyclobacteriaceae bacterium]